MYRIICKNDSYWFSALSNAEQQQFGGVSIYRCPSSGGPALRLEGQPAGPLSDYAALNCKVGGQPNNATLSNWPSATDNTTNPGRYMVYDEGTANSRQNTFRGPFKIPVLEWNGSNPAQPWNSGQTAWTGGDRITNWEFSHNFSDWKDGTSNQLCFTEKHIPSWALRRDPSLAAGRWNGSYLYTDTSNLMYIITRYASTNRAELIAKSPQDEMEDHIWGQLNYQLGSSHPGVINMLVGDGAVRGVTKTVDPEVLFRLTHTNDGVSVSLP